MASSGAGGGAGGGNKISYRLDRPTYDYSTATTQFDDELLRRDIITFEQAMLAKGASAAEARRLADLHRRGQQGGEGCCGGGGGSEDDLKGGGRRRAARRRSCGTDDDNADAEDDRSSQDDDDDDDDEFLASYRTRRLRQLRDQSRYGDVLPISRSDWTREVNDASRGGQWVVIHLTRGSSDTATAASARHVDACEMAGRAVSELAGRFPAVKFVSIAASAANERWPPHNLPALLCYRDGALRCQLVGVAEFGGHGITTDRVEWRLAQLGVLETELEDDPERGSYELVGARGQDDDDYLYDKYNAGTGTSGAPRGRSQFGGMMSTWATRRGRDDEEDLSDID
jgi:hypothetical protein